MTIKIEIPSDEEHKSLAVAIGKALYQYGSGVELIAPIKTTESLLKNMPSGTSIVGYDEDGKPQLSVPVHHEPVEQQSEINVTTDQYEQLANDASQPNAEDDGALPTLDEEGLPYDKRINSDPATINADGTWKSRRKPKEMTKEEWLTYIDGVKAELRQALSGEPIVDEQPEVVAPPVVTEETVVPPPVTNEQPEVIAPPNETNTVELPDRTFAELMKLITSNNGKITVDRVNQLINAHGVKSLPLLNSVRPDLIKVVYAEIESEVNTNG